MTKTQDGDWDRWCQSRGVRKWDLMDSSPRDIAFGFDGSAGRAECTSVGKSFFFFVLNLYLMINYSHASQKRF